MADKEFKYVEPVDYFPKEIREKIFGITEDEKPKRKSTKKSLNKKTEVKKNG